MGPEWTARPLARLRDSAAGWRLYWPDRNVRWHLVDDVPAATSVGPLLEAAASPCRTANLPQIRLEPVLKAHAERFPEADIRFHHELVGIEQDAERAVPVAVAYLLGADGGRTVGDFVGIGMSGPTNLMRMVSTHMTADLSAYLEDPDVLIRCLVNPDFGVHHLN